MALSFDFDAISGLLGTGDRSDNNMLLRLQHRIFAGRVGARRLVLMLQKYGLANKTTWFVPGHTMKAFESTLKEIFKRVVRLHYMDTYKKVPIK